MIIVNLNELHCTIMKKKRELDKTRGNRENRVNRVKMLISMLYWRKSFQPVVRVTCSIHMDLVFYVE